VHCERRPQRAACVIVLRHRRAEHGDHRVTEEVHHGAFVGHDRLAHSGPVGAELRCQHRRIGML